MGELAEYWKDIKKLRKEQEHYSARSNLDVLSRLCKQHDIGFRIINRDQGHIRVDGDIDFWIRRAKWWRKKSETRGQGVASLISYILEQRESN